VSDAAPQLPVDIESLQALLVAMRAERDAAMAERDQALLQNDRLRHLLHQLQRWQFGRRSEQLDPDQLFLALEDIEQAIAGSEADDDKKNPTAARARAEKRRANRGALPAHLPRVDVTIEPDDTNCPCCRAPMHVIGEETSQRLDVVPAQFRVITLGNLPDPSRNRRFRPWSGRLRDTRFRPRAACPDRQIVVPSA
jgi:transposase